MKVATVFAILLALLSLLLPGCSRHKPEYRHETQKITATRPQSKTMTLTQSYVCRIQSCRHITVRALEVGYLEAIPIQEGQEVNEGDVLFKITPALYQSKLDAENAEAKLAQLELNDTKKRYEGNAAPQSEVMMLEVKLAKAKAKAKLAAAELNFASIKAPFGGIVDRLKYQQGSLVKEGEVLTTLSDNSVMSVYFDVPESRYLDYMANLSQRQEELKIELVLANGQKFAHPGKIAAIEADFARRTGSIPFRADFPNPQRLLRHGQTGSVLISRVEKDAIVIPQLAAFEIENKRYVYVVDKDDVAHQREIVIQNELEDRYLVKKGVTVDDRIVLEGIREVRDGAKVEYEDLQPEQVVANLKYHAE